MNISLLHICFDGEAYGYSNSAGKKSSEKLNENRKGKINNNDNGWGDVKMESKQYNNNNIVHS